MIMKSYKIQFIVLLVLIFILPVKLNSQEDALQKNCNAFLKSPYVSTGQTMKAFLTDDEVAEFHTTLYEGSIYRIVACSHEQESIIFSVYDKDHNLLFSSNEHTGVNFWDFKMQGSIECIIEARLNSKKATSGLAMLMIGFKSQMN